MGELTPLEKVQRLRGELENLDTKLELSPNPETTLSLLSEFCSHGLGATIAYLIKIEDDLAKAQLCKAGR